MDILASQGDLIKNFKKICICKSITQGAIMAAIQDGALSFEALRGKLRTGTGYCKARRCRPKIQALVKDYKKNLEETPLP